MPPVRAGQAGVSADNIIEGSRKRARNEYEGSPSAGASLSVGNGMPRAGSSGAGASETRNEREDATYKGFKLLDAVLHKIDSNDGQPLAIPFLALPSKLDYPDYYNIVKTPLSFEGVRRRLVDNDFESFDAVRHTLEGVCRNAKRYNQNGSEIFEKARQLHSYIRDAYVDLVEKGAIDRQAGEVIESTPSLQVQSLKLAKEEKPNARARLDFDEDGVNVPRIDLRLKRADDVAYMEDGEDPGEGDEDADGEDEEDIDDAGVGDIAQDQKETAAKVEDNDQAGLAQPVVVKRGRGRPRGSGKHQIKAREEMAQGQQASTRITLRRSSGRNEPSTEAQEPEDKTKAVLRKELEKIKDLKDEDEDDVCEAFLELPSRRAYPDYYKLITKPISLEEIETSIEDGTYESVFDFVTDVQRMVDNAQFYNEDGSIIWLAAEQIKAHLAAVTVPILVAAGFAPPRNGLAANVKGEDGQSGQGAETNRLRVRLSSRGTSASASPALDSKAQFEPQSASRSSSSAMGPPPHSLPRHGSNGVHPGSAMSPTPMGPGAAVGRPNQQPMQMAPGVYPRPPGPVTPAQHLQAHPGSMPQQRPPASSPSYHPPAPGQIGQRPPGMSPVPGPGHSPMMSTQQPRPPYPSRLSPHQQMSPSPGPNGIPVFQGRPSPQYGVRPGMHGPPGPPGQPGPHRPPNAMPHGQMHLSQPANLGRPPRRLNGEGPFDPLSVLKLETEDGRILSRKPVTQKFTVRTQDDKGQICETVLRNKVVRVHSVYINAPKQTDALTEVVFRLRGVIQRQGEHETPFTTAPDWKVQLIHNGRGVRQIGHKPDAVPKGMTRPNGKAASAAQKDGSGEDGEDADPLGEGNNEAAKSKHNGEHAMKYSSGQGGVFDVPPFSLCSFKINPIPGLNVLDVAIAPPPPDAELSALIQPPSGSETVNRLSAHARALLNVPERFRIFLQCE